MFIKEELLETGDMSLVKFEHSGADHEQFECHLKDTNEEIFDEYSSVSVGEIQRRAERIEAEYSPVVRIERLPKEIEVCLLAQLSTSRRFSRATFKCSLCEAIFTYACNLRRHIACMHEEPEKLNCNECDKSFKSKWHLTLHVNGVHRNIRNHKCPLCTLSFATNSNLKAHHTYVHTKLRMFICGVCNKSFNRKDNLSIHANTVHSGRRPFKCQRCSKRFKTLHFMKTHMRLNHQ